MSRLHNRVSTPRGNAPCVVGAILAVLVSTTMAAGAAERDAWIAALREARDRDPSRDAAGAVDGIIDGGYNFHTAERGEQPWWRVDLGKSVTLDRVVIWNRVSLWQRARTITVSVSDDARTWREVYRHDGSQFLGFKTGKPLTISLDGESGAPPASAPP